MNNTTDIPVNSTSIGEAEVNWHWQWVFSMVFTFVAAPCLCYAIAALTYYSCKKHLSCCQSGAGPRRQRLRSQTLQQQQQQQQQQQKQQSQHTRVFAERPRAGRHETRGAGIVNSLLVISALAALMYVSIEAVLVSLPPPPGICTHYHRAKIISYGLCVVSVYLTLWFRVFTAFYWQSITKGSTSKCAQVINVAAILALVILTVANYAVFLSSPTYVTTSYGCAPAVITKSTKFKWIILGGTTIVCQLLMLASLVYPLHLHRRKMLGRGFNSRKVIPMIQRSALMTAVCIASDIFTSIFAAAYKYPAVYMNHVVLSSNLLVNVACVICSFADYREKLLPFPCCSAYIAAGRYRRGSQGDTTSDRRRSSARSRGTSVSAVAIGDGPSRL